MDPREMYRPRAAADITVVRAGVGVAIRDTAGRLVLERRSDSGLWGFPGGRVDAGEAVAATAQREAREETGLEIRLGALVGVYSNPATNVVTFPDNVVHLVDTVIEAEVVGGALAASSESLEVRWFSLDALPPAEEIVPAAKAALADIVAGRRGVVR